MKVIKRDGRKVEYDSDKIVIAISQANKEVGGKDKISRESIEFITKYIESLDKATMSVEDIQDIVERKLMEFGKFTLAKKYILYREKHNMIRRANSTDDSILSLVRNSNKDTMEENSNKNAFLAATQRLLEKFQKILQTVYYCQSELLKLIMMVYYIFMIKTILFNQFIIVA